MACRGGHPLSVPHASVPLCRVPSRRGSMAGMLWAAGQAAVAGLGAAAQAAGRALLAPVLPAPPPEAVQDQVDVLRKRLDQLEADVDIERQYVAAIQVERDADAHALAQAQAAMVAAQQEAGEARAAAAAALGQAAAAQQEAEAARAEAVAARAEVAVSTTAGASAPDSTEVDSTRH